MKIKSLAAFIAFHASVFVGLYFSAFFLTGGAITVAMFILSIARPDFIAWSAPHLWKAFLILAVPLWIALEINSWSHVKKALNKGKEE